MLRSTLALLFLLTAVPVWAQDLVPAPKIKFPTVSVPVVPRPTPVATDADKLEDGVIYVIESDVEFFILTSPADKLTITYETGPLKIRGKFIDGTGVETRTLSSKFMAIIDPVVGATGRVELFAIPKGVQDPSSIVRRIVELGHAPQPPPDVDPQPDPVPEPEPEPAPTPAPTGFRVLFIYETSQNLTRDQMLILYSSKISDFLNDKTVKSSSGHPEWRRWDKDIKISSKESDTLKALWDSVIPKVGKLPQMVIAVNGRAEIYDLPANEEATLELLRRKAEGK